MGLMASKPELGLMSDADWFLRHAGAYQRMLVAIGERTLKDRAAAAMEGEIIRVPCVVKTGGGTEDISELFPISARLVPNPGSTSCLIVGYGVSSDMLIPGDVIVLDTSQNQAADLRPFWDQLLLVEAKTERAFNARTGVGVLHPGLSIGRLQCKQYVLDLHRQSPGWIGPDSAMELLIWIAILSPFANWKTTWKYGDEGIYLGEWRQDPLRLTHCR